MLSFVEFYGLPRFLFSVRVLAVVLVISQDASQTTSTDKAAPARRDLLETKANDS